jgi:antitoxin component YwqK of YwqJK toxin-antitoxin module
MKISALILVGLSTCAGLLTQCAPPPLEKAAVTQIELRADGLTYISGTQTPYSGNYQSVAKNLATAEEVNYLNGKLHGPSIRYYETTGIIRRRIDYEEGIRVRKRAWYPNGQLRADEAWQGSQLIGLCTYWFDDGRLRKQISFAEGFQPTGQIIEYNQDGTVICDIILDNGKHVSGHVPPDYAKQVRTRYFSDPTEKEDNPTAGSKSAAL